MSKHISSLVFCAAALIISTGLFVGLYPLAAMPQATVVAAKTPTPAEDMGDLDLGDFGTISVIDLVGYYVDNPPAPVAAGTVKPVIRFGGC